MEFTQNPLTISSYAVFILAASYYIWKVLNWVWFRPKRLERRLRELGFRGNRYRLFFGDSKEIFNMLKEAKSKPMEFSNDIVPRVMPFLHKARTTYGPNFFVWFGPRPVVAVLDPDIVREVFAKNYTFPKPVYPLLNLLLQGLAVYEGDKWAKHRRLITPPFHLDKLKNMLPSFHASCCDMLSKWEEIAPRDGSCELDIWPYLETLTCDVISRTAFGSSYEEGKKIFDLQKEQTMLVWQAARSIQFPGRRFLATKTNRRMKEIRKEVESRVLDIINKRIKKIEAGESSSNDLLSTLLETNYNEIQQNGNGSGMTVREVIEECKLFYFAGQETSSCLLAWTMVLLSKHLDWQARAREEVLQSFGKEKPEFEQLNHLKVVSMILHEVLRLYPPVSEMNRMTGDNCTLGKLEVPAGVQLLLPSLLMHHDCKIWGEDATEFNPERFSEGVANATKGQLTYFPFGGGPRICIGQNFAMLEAKMALAMILQHYSFELSPSYAHAPHTVMILQPQHGAHLILHKL